MKEGVNGYKSFIIIFVADYISEFMYYNPMLYFRREFIPEIRKTNAYIIRNFCFSGSSSLYCSCINRFKVEERKNMDKKLFGMPVLVLCLLVCFVVMCNPFVMVGPGERGIKIRLGEVEPECYGEGLHLIFPFIQKFRTMDVKTQRNTLTTSVYTKDIQQAKITYVINYNVQPDKVNKLFQEVGMDYVSTILTPVVEGTIKDIIGKWNAQDLIANREKATGDILFKLQAQLADNYINVTDFQMTEINYSEVFERAIESKVTAEQEALKAKNKTVQVEEEAKQKVIAAEAEAKSMAIRARALSQNKSLVQYEAVQKWDGKMPKYMMGDAVPFINVSGK